MDRFFIFITAACISTYWLTVIVKSILIKSKIGKAPNVLPKEWQGLLSRIIMLPMILYWIYLPWSFLITNKQAPYPIISIVGSTLAVIALSLSYYCWHFMGKSWRIGIDPQEKTEVICSGPFKYSRHPIYALSMLLMLATTLTLQSSQSIILWCIHFSLFYLEARREEAYMILTHKQNYIDYALKTRRFI